VLVTIGPRVITLKVPSSLILSSMLSDERPRLLTVSRVSKSPTLLVVEPVLVWVHF
jgi:hypothetical protein